MNISEAELMELRVSVEKAEKLKKQTSKALLDAKEQSALLTSNVVWRY